MNTHLSFSLARVALLPSKKRLQQHRRERDSQVHQTRPRRSALHLLATCCGNAHRRCAALEQSNYPDCTLRSMPLWKLNGISKVNKWKMAHVVQIQIYAKVFKIQRIKSFDGIFLGCSFADHALSAP